MVMIGCTTDIQSKGQNEDEDKNWPRRQNFNPIASPTGWVGDPSHPVVLAGIIICQLELVVVDLIPDFVLGMRCLYIDNELELVLDSEKTFQTILFPLSDYMALSLHSLREKL